MSHPYKPVIIIGAARSGTNMLRDVLTRLPKVGTWPCDEINYIWRHGNAGNPLDELQPTHATKLVCQFIRRAFDRIAQQQHLDVVVEKTCANSLRVGFVDRVVPDAKYLYITRDGRDVVASAMKCWSNPIDLGYIARKARFVPWSDVPFYGSRYVANRLYHLFSGQKRLAFWGPRFDGMQDMLSKTSLGEVCAAQWVRSTELAKRDLDRLGPTQVHSLCYENFVREPQVELRKIIDFLDIKADPSTVSTIVENVTQHSVAKWRHDLDEQTLKLILPIIQPTLDQLEIDPATSRQRASPGLDVAA